MPTRSRPPRHLAQVVGEVSALLEAAYETFWKMMVARRRGVRSKVLERDVEGLIDMLADLINEGESVDGDVVWAMALMRLGERRAAIEVEVVKQVDGAKAVLDREGRRMWKLFLARLSVSQAGREWGMLSVRAKGRWS